MKRFYYDTLLDEENICNLNREKSLLWRGIEAGKKLVVYGPRNCGKTSLVKNVIVPKFKKKRKAGFVLFCDFMEVRRLEDVNQRLHLSFERAFAECFPRRKIVDAIKKFLIGLRAQIQFDPLSGQPSVILTSLTGSRAVALDEIFATIKKEIAPRLPTLIIFDEFQDISFVPQAEGLLRQSLQEIRDIPMIFMGSKKHILSDIFARPQAPLALMGEDIEFSPIPHKEYHEYILERFSQKNIGIDLENSTQLQDALFRMPESINIVCAHILDHFEAADLTSRDIHRAIDEVVELRSARYQEYLSLFSSKEESVLVALAKKEFVDKPTGHEFLSQVPVSVRAVSQIFKRFLDKSVLEKTKKGYRIGDPLLHYFLRKFR